MARLGRAQPAPPIIGKPIVVPAVVSTNIKTVEGLAKASVKTVLDLTMTSVKTIEGLA